MNRLLFAGLCLFSTLTIAAPAKVQSYHIHMLLTVGKSLPEGFELVTQEGKMGAASIDLDGKETFIEVTPKESKAKDQPGISLKFNIGMIDKDGKKTILGTPEVITENKVPATITVGEDKKLPAYSLTVTPTRK